MNLGVTQLQASLPENLVKKALDDFATQDGLLGHALAILGKTLINRPLPDRLDMAKEACQETYSKALQNIHQYDPERPVEPWLHGIMNNVLSEMNRELRRAPVQEPAERAAWEGLVVDLFSEETEVANRHDLDTYLAKLAPEHRKVVELRFYDGLSHENLAARLKITPGNARVRLCRALNALKELAGVVSKEERP